MGMYDNVVVNCPLPYSAHQNLVYQTKNTPEPFFRNFIIDTNGQLLELCECCDSLEQYHFTGTLELIGLLPNRKEFVHYFCGFEYGKLKSLELKQEKPFVLNKISRAN